LQWIFDECISFLHIIHKFKKQ